MRLHFSNFSPGFNVLYKRVVNIFTTVFRTSVPVVFHLGFKSESALKVLVRCHAISQFFSFFRYAFLNESFFKDIHNDTLMIYREFGKTGFKCSVIGMGTYYDPLWILGAKFFGLKKGEKKHTDAVTAGLDAGINLIDTAELYGTEKLVSQSISGRKRDEIFIATKVFFNHLRYDSVVKACDRSLRNMGTSYIDLYQIHFPSKRVKIDETMRAMEKLVDDGKIRHIGISNFNLQRTKEAQAAMKKYEIISTQMPYNLSRREFEKDLLPYCRENRIAVLPYYPLGHGKLIDRNSWPQDLLNGMLEKYRIKSTAQIALNWLITKSDLIFPIPRASSRDHVLDNAAAADWVIDAEDVVKLETAFPV